MVENPILRGFHPDPSICRVGADYYIATSTFEWFPGVRIHHSRDLANWRLAARPLNRPELLDLEGVPDSCGVWAPCLTWHEGMFYLCYTVVRRFDGNFKDTRNYLTTCEAIDGKWSDPVYLNSSGFDPSLYHAPDGRKWLLNMVWDHRPDRTFFGGISLQEFALSEGRLVGERSLIFEGTEHDCTEGPHLYRVGDYHYLMTAEGGTGYDHLITMARSRDLHGPYEVDPAGPVLTSRDTPQHPLQRAGHGDLVDSPVGGYFLVHLCSRPLPGTRRSPLGRETAIQRVKLTADGWFRLASGGQLPEVSVDVGAASSERAKPSAEHSPGQVDRFDKPELPPRFQWLRCPRPAELFSLEERPGYLRLFGLESPGSLYRQALVARRQEDFSYEAQTEILFEPEHFQQMAGLICYYNSSKFHYLYISRDTGIGKHLAVMSCEGDAELEATFPSYADRTPLPEEGRAIRLRARVNGAVLAFSWADGSNDWTDLPLELDASVLSDEAGKGEGAQFTGAFVGMCCQDLAGTRRPADFAWFSYRPLPLPPARGGATRDSAVTKRGG